MELYWIHDAKNDKRFEKLIDTELRDLLQKTNEDEIQNIYLWKKGLTNWIKLTEATEIFALYQSLRSNLQPPNLKELKSENVEVAPIPIIEKLKQATLKVDKMNQSSNDTLRALQQAHQKMTNPQLKVIIESGSFIYRTFVDEINDSGLTVSHELPVKNLARECFLYVSKINDKKIVKINANPVSSESNSLFFSFSRVDSQTSVSIKHLIAEKQKSIGVQ